MEIEQGIVDKTEENWAWISIQKKGACDRCGQKGHCQTVKGQDRMTLKAQNSLGAGIGDLVEVGFHEGIRLKIAFMAYILPVLGLLCGAFLGMGIADSLGWNRDLGSVLFALVGLGSAFLATHIFDKRASKRREYIPSISRIRKSGSRG